MDRPTTEAARRRTRAAHLTSALVRARRALEELDGAEAELRAIAWGTVADDLAGARVLANGAVARVLTGLRGEDDDHGANVAADPGAREVRP